MAEALPAWWGPGCGGLARRRAQGRRVGGLRWLSLLLALLCVATRAHGASVTVSSFLQGTPGGDALDYTEQGADLVMQPNIVITHSADSAVSTVTIRATAQQSGDLLELPSASRPASIAVTYDSVTNTLTLSAASGSNPTEADWQSALRAVVFKNVDPVSGTGPFTNPSGATRNYQYTLTQTNAGEVNIGFSQNLDFVLVNDAPTVTIPTTSLAYTEGDANLVLASGLTIADPESNAMKQAVITVDATLGGFQSGSDVLGIPIANAVALGVTCNGVAVTAGSAASVCESTTGNLTLALSGSAAIADWQAALRAVFFRNSAPNIDVQTRRVSFVVTDSGVQGVAGGTASNVASAAASGAGACSSCVVAIAVTKVNSAPVLTCQAASSGTCSYTSPYVEDNDFDTNGDHRIDPSMTLTDVDSANMERITVAFTSGYVAGEDFLLVHPNCTLSSGAACSTVTNATFDATAGSLLVLFANAAAQQLLAETQTIVRNIAYRNVKHAPVTATRQVSFTVRDKDSQDPKTSNAQVVAISVTPRNDFPAIQIRTQAVEYGTDLLTNPAASTAGRVYTVQPALNITDLDNSTVVLAQAIVSLGCSGNGTDNLAASSVAAGISCAYVQSSCTLTCTGEATKELYQSTMRSVVHTITGDTGVYKRSINFRVEDGRDASDTSKAGQASHPNYVTVSDFWASDFMPTPTLSAIAAFDGNAAGIPTSGGQIRITGTGFGPQGVRADSVDASGVRDAVLFAAQNLVNRIVIGNGECTNIVVTVEETEIRCTAPEGFGTQNTLSVVVSSKQSTELAGLTYQPPTVTAVTPIPTPGGSVNLTGTNFGPLGSSGLDPNTPLTNKRGSVTFTIKSVAVLCQSSAVTVAHTQITCTVPTASTGSGYNVEVQVAGQTSGTVASIVKYADPTIDAGVFRASFLATNNAPLTITGANFGPAGTNIGLSVNLQPAGSTNSSEIFACSSPQVLSHTSFKCTPPRADDAAVGIALSSQVDWENSKLFRVIFTQDGLSVTAENKFRYEGPVITAVANVSHWGEDLTITGRNFGPNLVQDSVAPNERHVMTVVHAGGNTTYDSTTADVPAPACSTNKYAVVTEDTTFCGFLPTWRVHSLQTTVLVTVTIKNQRSNAFTVTYAPPQITSTIEASHLGGGPGGIGTAVAITGKYLVPRYLGQHSNPGLGTPPSSGANAYPLWAAFSSLSNVTDYVSMQGNAGTLVNVSNAAGQFVSWSSSSEVVHIFRTVADESVAGSSAPTTGSGRDILLTLNGLTTGTSGNGRVNFLPHTLTNVSSVDTGGGTVTIFGSRLGPTGTTFFNTGSFSGAGVKVCATAACATTVDCTSPTVTVQDTALTCTLAPPSSPGYLDQLSVPVNVSMAGANVQIASAFSVNPPTITGLQKDPAEATFASDSATVRADGSERFEITGTSLGQAGYAVVLTVKGVPCVNVTYTTAHTKITCFPPPGIGQNATNPVQLKVRASDGSNRTADSPTGVTYTRPIITSIDPVGTEPGSPVVIRGVNFGPPGTSLESDWIMDDVTGVVLASKTVVNDTTITLTKQGRAAGSTLTGNTGVVGSLGGADRTLIAKWTDPYAGTVEALFSYKAPTISEVVKVPWISSSTSGDVVEIRGSDFGDFLYQTTLSFPQVPATYPNFTNVAPGKPTIAFSTVHSDEDGVCEVLSFADSPSGVCDARGHTCLRCRMRCALNNVTNALTKAPCDPRFARDVTFTRLGQSNTVANRAAKMVFIGPNVTAASDTYMFGGVEHPSALTCTNCGDGAAGQATKTALVDVRHCPYTTIAECNSTGAWLSANNGGTPTRFSANVTAYPQAQTVTGETVTVGGVNRVANRSTIEVIISYTRPDSSVVNITSTFSLAGPPGGAELMRVKAPELLKSDGTAATPADLTSLLAVRPFTNSTRYTFGAKGIRPHVGTLPLSNQYNSGSANGIGLVGIVISDIFFADSFQGLTPTNPVVNSDTSLSLTFPDGFGTRTLNLLFQCDTAATWDASLCKGQTGAIAYKYGDPVVVAAEEGVVSLGAFTNTSTALVSPNANTNITVKGYNFGASSTISPRPINVLFTDALGNLVNVTDSIFGVAHNATAGFDELKVTIPPGRGKGLKIFFGLLDQNVTSGPLISYAPPTLASVTTVPTGPVATLGVTTPTGGANKFLAVNITGSNFGPVGDLAGVASVTLIPTDVATQGSLESTCRDPKVLVANTVIQCYVGEGSGSGYDVRLCYGDPTCANTQTGDVVTLSRGFSYLPPTLALTPEVNFFGTLVNETFAINGTNFGPAKDVSTRQFSFNTVYDVRWRNSAGTEAVCSSPATNADNLHRQLVCTVPNLATAYNPNVAQTPFGGADLKGISLFVNVSNQQAFTTSYNFSRPTIVNATRPGIYGGPFIINGHTFGPVGDTYLGNVFWTNGQTLLQRSSAQPTVVTTNTQIRVIAPPGTGLTSVAINVGGYLTVGGTGVVSYRGPVVVSATEPLTAGGTLNITGENFGPVRQVASPDFIIVNGFDCTSTARVLAQNTSTGAGVMSCDVPEGSGSGYTIQMQLKGTSDESSGVGKFKYANPVVTNVTTLAGGPNPSPGERVLISGTSFGKNVTADAISATVNGLGCTDVAVTANHTQIACTMNAAVTGRNKVAQVTVKGLTSAQFLFDIAAPVITSVSNVTSRGGLVVMTANNTGPVGSTFLTGANAISFGSANCSSPTVVAVFDNGARGNLTCTLPQLGTTSGFSTSDLDGDGAMDVVLRVSGTPSAAYKWSFDAPELTRIVTPEAFAGQNVTFAMKNAGAFGSNVAITFRHPSGAVFPADMSTAVATHDFVFFPAPPGYGASVTFEVFVFGREALYTNVTGTTNQATKPTWKFAAPSVRQGGHTPPANTTGGDTDIFGTGFGPVRTGTNVVVTLTGPMGVFGCTNPRVIVPDIQLRCTVPPGAGAQYSVRMVVDAQVNTDLNQALSAWRYPAPAPAFVTPRSLAAGTNMTINGTNFGPIHPNNTVRVLFRGPNEPCGGLLCENVTLVEAHGLIRCVAPLGVGRDVNVVVEAAGQDHSPINTVDTKVEWALQPNITSVTRARTAGQQITITGNGFGPAGTCYQQYITRLELRRGSAVAPCANALVTQNGTTLTCDAPAGTGALWSVFLEFRGNYTAVGGTAAFSYLAPNITNSTRAQVIGGFVEFDGDNFGADASLVSVQVTPPAALNVAAYACTSVSLPTAHRVIRCTVPSGLGGGYDVLVTVDGQTSGATGNAILSRRVPKILITNPKLEFFSGDTDLVIVGKDIGLVDLSLQTNVYIGQFLADQRTLALTQKFGTGTTCHAPYQQLYGVDISNENCNEIFEIRIKVPNGSGIQQRVEVDVAGVRSNATADNAFFDYQAPFVTSSTTASTKGGVIQISGQNFGPVGTVIDSVTIGTRACANPVVLQSDTVIQCEMPEGVGKDQDIIVAIGGKNSSASGQGKYRYTCPEVLSLTVINTNDACPPGATHPSGCVPGRTGQTLRIQGRNFGRSAADISMKVKFPASVGAGFWNATGGDVILTPAYTQPAPGSIDDIYSIDAVVPSGFGFNLPVAVEVAGQDSLQGCATPREDPTSQALLYSYEKPVIRSHTFPGTRGGPLFGQTTLYGSNFGPVGTAGLTVTVVPWCEGRADCAVTSRQCANATVVVDNVEILCYVPEGEGANLQAAVVRPSELTVPIIFGTFRYARPVIDRVLVGLFRNDTPPTGSAGTGAAQPGDTITVYGNNFGTRPDLATLGIFDDVTGGLQRIGLVQLVGSTFDLPKSHTKITFLAPNLNGNAHPIQVNLLASLGTLASSSILDGSTRRFSYAPPTITSIDSAPTAGGPIVLRGTGFGPLGNRDLVVTINGQNCPDAQVVALARTNGAACPAGQENVCQGVALNCTAPAGTGRALSVGLLTGRQTATAAIFSYRAPTILGVTPATQRAGQQVTINGTNFGTSATGVSVFLGSFPCTVTAVTSHNRIQCTVGPHSGLNQQVRVLVNGQSVTSTTVRFTYDFAACNNPFATNFNPNATRFDPANPCVVDGCTNSLAANFNPDATRDDGTCREADTVITQEIPKNCELSKSEPTKTCNDLIAVFVANTGLTAPNRTSCGPITCGSTIMDLRIRDDPRDPARAYADRVQALLQAGTWSAPADFRPIRVNIQKPTPLTGATAGGANGTAGTGDSVSLSSSASEGDHALLTTGAIIGIAVAGAVVLAVAVLFIPVMKALTGRKGTVQPRGVPFGGVQIEGVGAAPPPNAPRRVAPAQYPQVQNGVGAWGAQNGGANTGRSTSQNPYAIHSHSAL